MRPDISWLAKPMRGIGLNIWAPEWYAQSISNFHAPTVGQHVATSHANLGFTFQGLSQDHFGLSYFPTTLGPMHHNLGGNDNLRAYIDALHEQDIPIFAYYSYPDRGEWERNPDWRQKDINGNDLPHPMWFGALCPNSPYRDHLVARTLEIAERYEVDGFLLADDLHFVAGGCYCLYCARKYRELYGADLPASLGTYDVATRRFLAFRYDSVSEVYRELAVGVRAVRPAIAVTHNTILQGRTADWVLGEDYEKTMMFDDVVTSIVSWGGVSEGRPTRSADLIWRAGYITNVLRGLSGKHVWTQMGRSTFSREYHTLPLHELRLAAYSVVSDGGSPIFIDNLFPDGSVDEVAMERLSVVLAELEQWAPYLTDRKPVDCVGLYFSGASRDYLDITFAGEDRFASGLEGAFHILREGDIPVQVFGAAGTSPEVLRRFPVVVLPNVVAMSDREIDAFSEYVRGGGCLIVTSLTSMADEVGTRRQDFGLKEALGGAFSGLLNYPLSYIALRAHPICDGLDPREKILTRGLQVRFTPETEVAVAASMVRPATEVAAPHRVFTFSFDVPPGSPTGDPSVVTRELAAGRVVYFAGDITLDYARYGDGALREMLLNAVRWGVNGAVMVQVQGTRSVRCTVFSQGGRLLAFLLNYAGTCMRSTGGAMTMEGPNTCRDLTLRLSGMTDGLGERAILASNGQELDVMVSDGVICITVPSLELFDIVVLGA